jgi:hypothetical protein
MARSGKPTTSTQPDTKEPSLASIEKLSRYRQAAKSSEYTQVGTDSAVRKRARNFFAAWKDLREKAKKHSERGVR